MLDSGSTDATVEIASRHGARIAVHPFDDYGPQKQRAIDSASHDWILNLDADEVLSAGTREVIEQALVAAGMAGFACRGASACSGRCSIRGPGATAICACSTAAARA